MLVSVLTSLFLAGALAVPNSQAAPGTTTTAADKTQTTTTAASSSSTNNGAANPTTTTAPPTISPIAAGNGLVTVPAREPQTAEYLATLLLPICGYPQKQLFNDTKSASDGVMDGGQPLQMKALTPASQIALVDDKKDSIGSNIARVLAVISPKAPLNQLFLNATKGKGTDGKDCLQEFQISLPSLTPLNGTFLLKALDANLKGTAPTIWDIILIEYVRRHIGTAGDLTSLLTLFTGRTAKQYAYGATLPPFPSFDNSSEATTSTYIQHSALWPVLVQLSNATTKADAWFPLLSYNSEQSLETINLNDGSLLTIPIDDMLGTAKKAATLKSIITLPMVKETADWFKPDSFPSKPVQGGPAVQGAEVSTATGTGAAFTGAASTGTAGGSVTGVVVAPPSTPSSTVAVTTTPKPA